MIKKIRLSKRPIVRMENTILTKSCKLFWTWRAQVAPDSKFSRPLSQWPLIISLWTLILTCTISTKCRVSSRRLERDKFRPKKSSSTSGSFIWPRKERSKKSPIQTSLRKSILRWANNKLIRWNNFPRFSSNMTPKAASFIRSQWPRRCKSWTSASWTSKDRLITQRKIFSQSAGRASEKEPLASMLASVRNTYVRSSTVAKSLFSKWHLCQTQTINLSATRVQAPGLRFIKESITCRVVAGPKYLWVAQKNSGWLNLVWGSCFHSCLTQASALGSRFKTDFTTLT